MRILPISKLKYATKMEIRNTYLVRIWYVFASLNTYCVFSLRISGFSLRIFLWAIRDLNMAISAKPNLG